MLVVVAYFGSVWEVSRFTPCSGMFVNGVYLLNASSWIHPGYHLLSVHIRLLDCVDPSIKTGQSENPQRHKKRRLKKRR